MKRVLIVTYHSIPALERWYRENESSLGRHIRILPKQQVGKGEGEWDVVVVIGGSLSLTREEIAGQCERFGWNPVCVHAFPLEKSFVPHSEAWLPRWEAFFRNILAGDDGIAQVRVHRLTSNPRVKVLSHPETKAQDIQEILTALKKRNLEVTAAEDEWHIAREGVNYRYVSSGTEETVGAFVIVPEVKEHFSLTLPDQVSDTRRLVPLSEFARSMEQKSYRRQRIAFLVPSLTTPPGVWERVFSLSKQLCEKDCAQVVVLCAETVVAGEGLEEAYRRSRQAGALYEKTDLSKAVFQETIDMRGIQVGFRTERDGADQTLLFDWLVAVPQLELVPFDVSGCFEADKIVLSLDRPVNSNLPPYALHFQGMYLISPFSSHSERIELAREVERYLSEGVIAEEARTEVDEEKCILCLTCVRTCPWGAVDVEGVLKRSKARVSWQTCRLCGLCASSCPAEAITIAGFPTGTDDMVPVISCGGEVS